MRYSGSYWDTAMDHDEDETDEDDADDAGDDRSDWASECLTLYLSDELIDQVRLTLSARDPKYAAILKSQQ